jgi:outer membrane lipoprotein-sorting protein
MFGQTKGASALDQVLGQMEAVGRNFRSFAANFSQKKYTSVLREFDTPETGEFFYARAGDGSALIRQEFKSPGVRILTISGGVATLYQPALKQAQVFGLGKNKDKAEFMALGIGQSPAKLQQTFDIRYLGVENVNGAPCSTLLLKPKSAVTAAYAASITLWIKKGGGIPVQEKLEEPNSDYLLVTFSNEVLNTKIPAAKFQQNLPKDVEIQRIQ